MFKSILLSTVLIISSFASANNYKERICKAYAEGFENYYVLRDKGYTHDFINGYVKSRTPEDKTVESFKTLYEMIKYKPIVYTNSELKSAANAYCLMGDEYDEKSD